LWYWLNPLQVSKMKEYLIFKKIVLIFNIFLTP